MEITKPKIVVTSLGVSSPLGNSIDSFLNNYVKNTNSENTHIDDNVLEMGLSNYASINQRRMDRLTRIAMMAAVTCLEKADLNVDESNVNNIGGIFCSDYGPIASSRDFVNSGFELGLDSASPIIFPYTVSNSGPGSIAILMKARGFSTTVSGYCPLAYAYDTIKNNKAKALLAGGFEELTPEMEQAYETRSILKENGETEISPLKAISEGAAMLFVEEELFALSRKANILFEICGYSVSSNPQKKEKSIDNFGYISHKSIQKTMEDALKRSEIEPSEISLVISLAREDSQQIESEESAIENIWKENQPDIHYTKTIMGETFGSSSCFAAIIGYEKGLGLKNTDNIKKYVMINSYHIGGNCFSLIIQI